MQPFPFQHGRLTVTGFDTERSSTRHPRVICQCMCGTVKSIQVDNLSRTHSCGCIKREMLKAKATHGMRHTPEYRIWADMIRRCSSHVLYEGRGITVCERWTHSFVNFHSDMGCRPSPKHTLDRIDNDGNYEPGNCRWASRKTQRINQRRTEILTFNGVTGTLKDLAEHFGITYSAAHQRRWLLKWPLERILTTPVQHRKS